MTLKRRIKRGWMNLRVDRIAQETHDTRTFYLVDAEEGGRQFDFLAGQYLTFRFDDLAEKPIVRSYTMSSSPCEPDYVGFTVKEVEDGFISRWLCRDLKVNDILRARGPIGKFYYEPEHDGDSMFIVAAGSGVTPFISMMREYAPHLGQAGYPKDIKMLLSYRSTQDLICWDVLQELNKHPAIDIVCTLSREEATGFLRGRIDDAMIFQQVQGQYKNRTFFSCGPEAIMQATIQHCLNHGVDAKQIKTESFES